MTHTAESLTRGPTDIRAKFKQLSLELQEVANKLNLKFCAFRSEDLAHFASAEPKTQEDVLRKAQTTLEIYNACLEMSGASFDHRTLVWLAFQKFNLKPTSDLIENISDEDVVQIFDSKGIQLFCNLRFFDLCSYTFEEVSTRDWTQLWERDLSSLERLQQLQLRALSPDFRTTYLPNMPEHRIRERNSPLMLELDYKIKAISPLWSRLTGERSAFIVIESGLVTSPLLTAVEEERAFLSQIKSYPADLV